MANAQRAVVGLVSDCVVGALVFDRFVDLLASDFHSTSLDVAPEHESCEWSEVIPSIT